MRSSIKRNVLKKLKPGLVAFYDIRPGSGSILRRKRKVKERKISGKAYDINKQTISIAPKSKIE